MKSKLVALLSVFLFISSGACIAQKSSKNKSLFTTANASKWEYVIKDKAVSPSEVFVLKDGLLQITGASTGYLRTKKTYTNSLLSELLVKASHLCNFTQDTQIVSLKTR